MKLDGGDMRKVLRHEIGYVPQDPTDRARPAVHGAHADRRGPPGRVAQPTSTATSSPCSSGSACSTLAHRLKSYPHEFSGGMRQRVAIAIALAKEPRLLIADEPTTALDVTTQVAILRLLDELRRERDLALLFVTHDLAVARLVCQDLAVMYGGLVVESGPIAEVMAAPRHPYTRALLDADSGHAEPLSRLRAIPGQPPPLTDLPPGCPFAPRCPLAEAGVQRRHPARRARSARSRCAASRPTWRWRRERARHDLRHPDHRPRSGARGARGHQDVPRARRRHRQRPQPRRRARPPGSHARLSSASRAAARRR